MWYVSCFISVECNKETGVPSSWGFPVQLMCCVDPDDPFKITEQTRSLGLVVCRGTAVVLICPSESMEQIANPFLQMPEEI